MTLLYLEYNQIPNFRADPGISIKTKVFQPLCQEKDLPPRVLL